MKRIHAAIVLAALQFLSMWQDPDDPPRDPYEYAHAGERGIAQAPDGNIVIAVPVAQLVIS